MKIRSRFGNICKRWTAFVVCVCLMTNLIFAGSISCLAETEQTDENTEVNAEGSGEINAEDSTEDGSAISTENSTGLELQSPSCILMEASTGTVLYEKNADEARKPASVTKVMTLLLIFEAISNGDYTLEDVVTVSEHAASMGGSQCFFEAGEQQTVEDMIKCIIIASGNDAAVAMAEFTSGSEELFVSKMNERAKELGMQNTNFVNACGLDADGHVTSSRDIAIMSRELITKHPDILNYSNIWMDSIIHKTARGESQFDLANTNKFLNLYTGATGLKTGYTATAKYCMSATASRNGIDLIAVIMGAETKDIRNSEACKLLDFGYAMCNLYEDENVLDTQDINIENGISDKIKIEADSHFSSVLIRGEKAEEVTKTLKLYDEDLQAPVKKGEIVGYMEYRAGERLIGAVGIVAAEDMKKMTFGYSVKRVFKIAFE